MKKVKVFFYWFFRLAFDSLGFSLFGVILAMLMKMPNNIFGGLLTWNVMILLYYYAAEDDKRELICKLMGKGD